MKLILSLWFVSIISFHYSEAQTSFNIHDDEYYKYRSRKLIFEDDFNDNRNKWIDTVGKGAEIKDGKFHFDKSKYGWTVDTAWDYNKDFEIEFAGRVDAKKVTMHAAAFEWGESCGIAANEIVFNHYLFEFYNWEFGKRVQKKHNNLHVSRPADSFNIYTIRKVDSEYHFFVNHYYRFSVPYKRPLGKTFGFGPGYRNDQFYIDYIRISYLD